jgi:hypothetical protein
MAAGSINSTKAGWTEMDLSIYRDGYSELRSGTGDGNQGEATHDLRGGSRWRSDLAGLRGRDGQSRRRQRLAQPGRRADHDAAGAVRGRAEGPLRRQSLRYAYPLASWAIEQSTDTTQRIITLQTEDGFKVRFSIPKDEQGLLGEALTRPMPEMSVRPN